MAILYFLEGTYRHIATDDIFTDTFSQIEDILICPVSNVLKSIDGSRTGPGSIRCLRIPVKRHCNLERRTAVTGLRLVN